MFMTSLFHAGMSFQFYSKFALYPLAFIIGCGLAIHDQDFIKLSGILKNSAQSRILNLDIPSIENESRKMPQHEYLLTI
jgi:hypothetical protein